MTDLLFLMSRAWHGFRRAGSGRAACLAGALAAAGCAQPAPVQVALPPPDGTACYQIARVPFYQSANTAFVTDQQVQASNQNNRNIAAIGAVATVAGLIAGGRTGNIIAGVGALTTVVAALSSNAQTDGRLIADMSYRFQGLAQCRQDEAASVRADVQARRLKVEEGRARLTVLRDLMLADADVARRVNYMLAQRNQTYSVEAADVDNHLASEPDPVARQQRAAQVAQARQTIQTNQRALTDQVSAIDKAAQTIIVSSVDPPPDRVRRT